MNPEVTVYSTRRVSRRAIQARGAVAIVAACLVCAWGCSPSYYERQADRQVSQIADERKTGALGYTPETIAPNDPLTEGAGTPNVKVPRTPIPTTPGNILEPLVIRPAYAPAGPQDPSTLPAATQSSGVLSDRRAGYSMPEGTYGPASPGDEPLVLDLFGVLRFALENSRDYRDQMEAVYLSTLDVTLERHLFEPTPFARQRLAYDGGQDDVDYRSALAATTEAGVRQRLPYGGEIVASGLVRFVNSLNQNIQDGESAQAALRATVPLLRGFGMVNLENLVQSERQLIYDTRNFENFRRAFVVDVSTQYFNLLATQSAVQNRRANLKSTIDVAERSQALFSAGKTSFVDVQRSVNSQINSESRLIQSEEAYQAQLDNFKVFLGMDPRKNLVVVPVDIELQQPLIDSEKAIELAWQYRLDLQTRRDQVDDAQRRINNARNGLLPDLNFDAGSTASNPDGTNALDFQSRTLRYNAGVTLDLPLDRVRERNAYRRAQIFAQQAQRDYQQARDSVAVAARNAIRRIRSAQARLELQRRNVEVARNRLSLAVELLQNPLINQAGGLGSSNRDVVEAQNQLLEAQDAFDQARTALQVQILNYFRDTGTLRLDPAAGTLSAVLDRAGDAPDITRPLGLDRLPNAPTTEPARQQIDTGVGDPPVNPNDSAPEPQNKRQDGSATP